MSPECPLPIKDDFLNRFRWDPWEAIAWFHVFRDRYERSIPPTRNPYLRFRKYASDWPEVEDMVELSHEMGDERDGKVVDRDGMAARRKRLQQITPSSPLWEPLMVYRGVHEPDK